jgi:molecular chaperone GrpE
MTKEDSNTQDGPIFQAEDETVEATTAEKDSEIEEAAEGPPEEGTEGSPEKEVVSEPGPEAEPDSETDEESELETVKKELDRLRDQHLRLAAEFQNHKKRASAELTGVWTRARADLVQSLVEGLDDLQRVSQFTCEDTTVEALIEGVDLVERNLLKALTEAGLEVLDPVGERFDPNTMEAMMRVPTEEEGQDETVHQVFQKGYLFKEQLVRPARVSVYMDDD